MTMASHTQDDASSTAGSPPAAATPAPRGRPVGRVGQRVGPFLLEERLEQHDAIGLYRASRPAGSRQPQHVAIRIVEDARNDRAAAWVRHEYDILLRLNHPGVPRAFGYYSSQVGVAMSVPPPFRLDDLLEAQRAGQLTLDVPTALEIVQEVASILRHAHGINGPDGPICHSHLSPRTIGLQLDGTVTVLGFGTTAPEVPYGYRPPEQVVGAFMDPRSDQWRIGALLTELLIGVPPYAELDDPEPAAVEGRVEPWVQRLERRHPEVARIVSKLLSPAAGSRYQNEGTLVRDLLEVTRHQSTSPDRRALMSHLRAREAARVRRMEAAEEARRKEEEAANPPPPPVDPEPEYVETPALPDSVRMEPRPTPVAPEAPPLSEPPEPDAPTEAARTRISEAEAPTLQAVVASESSDDHDSLGGPMLSQVLHTTAGSDPIDDPLSGEGPALPRVVGVTWEEDEEAESSEGLSLGLGRVEANPHDDPSLGPLSALVIDGDEPNPELEDSDPSLETTDLLDDGPPPGSSPSGAGPRPMKWFPSELAAMAAIGVAVIMAIFFLVWRFG